MFVELELCGDRTYQVLSEEQQKEEGKKLKGQENRKAKRGRF